MEENSEYRFEFMSALEAHEKLERLVKERTAELTKTNLTLQEKINELERTQKALIESETRLTLSLEATEDGLFDFNLKENEAFVSDNFLKMLGYRPGEFEVSFDTLRSLIHPEDQDAANAQIEQSLRPGGKNTYSVEYRILCSSGTYRWVHSRAKVVARDNAGKPLRLVGTNVDIHERKLRDQAFHLIVEGTSQAFSKDFFRSLVYYLSLIFNVKTACIIENDENSPNPLVLTALWSEAGKLKAKDFNPYFTPAKLIINNKMQYYSENLKKDFPEDSFISNENISGFWGIPIFKSGRSCIGVLCVMDTEPVKKNEYYESILRIFASRAGVEFERKKAEEAMMLAKEQAEAANKAKSEFLANMSHELRTPLNSILGYAQIMKNSSLLHENHRKGVDIIERSGDHLLTLINDILDLSKIEAGKFELRSAGFNFPVFLQAIANMAGIKARQKNLNFHFEKNTELPLAVKGDEKRLRQILLNLLSNAVKFTDKGGVTFKIGYEDKQKDIIRFQIDDTGPGISEDKQREIFMPFHQLSVGNEIIDGTGLGLAICKKLADMMNGEIGVESSPGEGSSFSLVVKLTKAKTANSEIIKPARLIKGYKGEKKKILLVDDKWENRFVIKHLLEPIGFIIEEAESGLEAINKSSRFKPVMIIIDLVMPGLDGYETTVKFRQNDNTKNTKIIAFSASVFQENKMKSLASGCDDFIPKPLKNSILFDIIKKHLGLEWIYDEDKEAAMIKNEFDAQFSKLNLNDENMIIFPPARTLKILYNLARIGDVQSVLEEIEKIKYSDSKYSNFASKINKLAEGYKMKQIRDFIKEHLDNS